MAVIFLLQTVDAILVSRVPHMKFSDTLIASTFIRTCSFYLEVYRIFQFILRVQNLYQDIPQCLFFLSKPQISKSFQSTDWSFLISKKFSIISLYHSSICSYFSICNSYYSHFNFYPSRLILFIQEFHVLFLFYVIWYISCTCSFCSLIHVSRVTMFSFDFSRVVEMFILVPKIFSFCIWTSLNDFFFQIQVSCTFANSTSCLECLLWFSYPIFFSPSLLAPLKYIVVFHC